MKTIDNRLLIGYLYGAKWCRVITNNTKVVHDISHYKIMHFYGDFTLWDSI